MSKIKTLESMLVNAADALNKVLRQVRSDQTPKQKLTNVEEILAHEGVSEALTWHRDHKRALKADGTKTVDAKVVTAKVAKERRAKDVEKAAQPVKVPGKKALMGKPVFFTKRKFSEVSRVFRRGGVRWVELADGQEFEASMLTQHSSADTGEAFELDQTPRTVKREKKAERAAREEEVHAIITKVAGNGAYVEANNLSAFCNKVSAALEAEYGAGEISRVLLRQCKAYVIDHHQKVDNMKPLKVKGAVAKVKRLTVKAIAKADDKGPSATKALKAQGKKQRNDPDAYRNLAKGIMSV